MPPVLNKVLIVSPRFPPSNGADMHRVRLSLPHFADFGWQPSVLAVDPQWVEGDDEPLLLHTVPRNADVTRVNAIASRGMSPPLNCIPLSVALFWSAERPSTENVGGPPFASGMRDTPGTDAAIAARFP